MYQVPKWQNIFCSNQGISLLCTVFYDNIYGRDQRMSQMITLQQLCYVVCLSFYYRLASINLDEGDAQAILELSDLRNATRGIELPRLLARYIECLGIVTLPSGVRVGPYFNNGLVFSDLMINPVDILTEAGRPIPPGFWHIDWEWISSWNAHTTRASRRSMGFGKVDYTIHEGRPELVVSYIEAERDFFTPYAPVQLSEEEAKLGACYMWRDYEQRHLWPGGSPEAVWNIFRASPINPYQVYNDLVTDSIINE